MAISSASIWHITVLENICRISLLQSILILKLSRIILNSKDEKTQQFWGNLLSNNTYDYVSLKSILSYNNIKYSEDIEEIQLPLVSNTITGTF